MYKNNMKNMILALSACLLLCSCGSKSTNTISDSVISPAPESTVSSVTSAPEKPAESAAVSAAPTVQETPTETPTETPSPEPTATPEPTEPYTTSEIFLSDDLPYASFSAIHSEPAILYTNNKENKNGHTVCVNAGHGTSGGESVRTQCHPDGTPKVTGGSTAEGSTTAMAVASGMDFADGTPERAVTLAEALVLRDLLLEGLAGPGHRERSRLDGVHRVHVRKRHEGNRDFGHSHSPPAWLSRAFRSRSAWGARR